jgi:hypothetical protein
VHSAELQGHGARRCGETQRGISQRFVVTPAHFEGGVVVRAADRFFVVEPGGYAFVQSQGSVK